MTMRIPLALFLAVIVTPLFAQPRTHDIVPEDYFSLASITEIAVSPSGKHVAYCQGTWDKADDARKTDLWIVATDGKSPPRRLTFDRANDRNPKWSGDGEAIYFVGNRKRAGETKPPHDGAAQVWKVMPDGRELQPVTRVDGGISGYDYAPKAGAMYYSVDVNHADDDEFAKLRTKHTGANYGHGNRKISEIHRLDLATWRTEKIVAEKRYIREFAVTRDGKRIAMVSAVDDTVVKSEGESRVDIWEQGEPGASATGGKITTPPTDVYRAKAASPHAWLESLAWNQDGTRFAFCAIFDAYPTEVIIGEVGNGHWKWSQTARQVAQSDKTRFHFHGYGTPLSWVSPTQLVSLVEDKGSVGVGTYNTEFGHHDSTSVHEGDAIYSYSRIGTFEYFSVRATKTNFAELMARDLIVDPNPHTKSWKLPTIQHITWKAPDGAEVGGVLELPYGYKKGDKLPLVVAIHGGPTTSTKAALEFDPHNARLYIAAAGYAVLCPNYRGSTGYGDKFVTDLIGAENDVEVKDILTGIMHLIKEGIADPDRVGVAGWSNGGYLTNCLITLKDSPVKFKAASSGAGILDTVAEWGFNDEPAYPKVFKKGHPWETPEIYRKTSPGYGLANVTTPTLIHVGANDERCPPGHSRMLYRALKEYLNVPTELVEYKGEPHGLSKMSNRRAKMEWDLAWFDKYLKNAKK